MDAANPQPNSQTIAFSPGAVRRAAHAIAAGQSVAVPTETVYGLAADATNAQAVAAIYARKGRPAFNPLIVHVPNAAAAMALGQFDAVERALAGAFWPGPLTLVVPRADDCPVASLVSAGLDTLALRVPAHRAVQALLAAAAVPLAAPSANASGRISPTSAAHVLDSLGRVPGAPPLLILDDGPCPAGVESTIVRVVGGVVHVLRAGPVTPDQLAAASGLPVVVIAPSVDGADGTTLYAPGQLASHYAPHLPLRLNADRFAADEWGIGFGALAGDDNLSARGDPAEAAARLFDALHRADASGRVRIAVATIADTGLGLAINDRLRRAAAPRV